MEKVFQEAQGDQELNAAGRLKNIKNKMFWLFVFSSAASPGLPLELTANCFA